MPTVLDKFRAATPPKPEEIPIDPFELMKFIKSGQPQKTEPVSVDPLELENFKKSGTAPQTEQQDFRLPASVIKMAQDLAGRQPTQPVVPEEQKPKVGMEAIGYGSWYPPSGKLSNVELVPEIPVDEKLVQQSLDYIRSLPEARKQLELAVEKTDFGGWLDYLNRHGLNPVEKIMGTEGVTAAHREAIRRYISEAGLGTKIIQGLAEIPQLAAEFGLTKGMLGPAGEATGLVNKASQAITRGAQTFAGQRAIQAPQPGETLKSKALDIAKSAGVGAVIGPAGEVIKNPAVRAPLMAAGFGGLTYAETGDVDAALQSAVTVLGFEALGLAKQAKNYAKLKYQQLTAGKNLSYVPDLFKGVSDAEVMRRAKTGEEAAVTENNRRLEVRKTISEVREELQKDKERWAESVRTTGKGPEDLIKKYSTPESQRQPAQKPNQTTQEAQVEKEAIMPVQKEKSPLAPPEAQKQAPQPPMPTDKGQIPPVFARMNDEQLKKFVDTRNKYAMMEAERRKRKQTTEVTKPSETTQINKDEIFLGNSEAGQVVNGLEVLGNFNTKKDAVLFANKNNGKVRGYIDGKYKRGWIVTNVIPVQKQGESNAQQVKQTETLNANEPVIGGPQETPPVRTKTRPEVGGQGVRGGGQAEGEKEGQVENSMRQQAQDLGVTYDGPQMKGDQVAFYSFTDPETRTSFSVKPGETVADKLGKARERFQQIQKGATKEGLVKEPWQMTRSEWDKEVTPEDRIAGPTEQSVSRPADAGNVTPEGTEATGVSLTTPEKGGTLPPMAEESAARDNIAPEKTAEAGRGLQQIKEIWDRFQDGKGSFQDVVEQLEGFVDDPELKEGVKNYLDAAEEDRFEYGGRSGLPEESEDFLTNLIEKKLSDFEKLHKSAQSPAKFSEGDIVRSIYDGSVYRIGKTGRNGVAKLYNVKTGQSSDWNALNNDHFILDQSFNPPAPEAGGRTVKENLTVSKGEAKSTPQEGKKDETPLSQDFMENYQRTTPVKGTPEREEKEAANREITKRYYDLEKEYNQLSDKLRKTPRGHTKIRSGIEKEKRRILEEMKPFDKLAKEAQQFGDLARTEDVAETTTNEAQKIGATIDLLHRKAEKEGYATKREFIQKLEKLRSQLQGIIRNEFQKQSKEFKEEWVREIANDIETYPLNDLYVDVPRRVDMLLRHQAAIKWKEAAIKKIDKFSALTGPEGDTASRTRILNQIRDLDEKTGEEKIPAILEEAKKANDLAQADIDRRAAEKKGIEEAEQKRQREIEANRATIYAGPKKELTFPDVATDENKVAAAEKVLGRKLTETESVLVTGAGASTSVAEQRVASEDVGDDFRVMVRDSKIFAKKIREAAVDQLCTDFGVQVAEPDKVAIPAKIKPGKAMDAIKAIKVFTAKEATRYAIGNILIDKDKTAVATDGRRMIVVPNFGHYVSGLEVGKMYGATKNNQMEDMTGTGKFPTWQDVVPDEAAMLEPLRLTREQAASLSKRISETDKLNNSGNEEHGIIPYFTDVNGDYNGFDPDYLADALNAVQKFGADITEVYFQKGGNKEVLFIGKDSKGKVLSKVVVMPVTVSKSGEKPSLKDTWDMTPYLKPEPVAEKKASSKGASGAMGSPAPSGTRYANTQIPVEMAGTGGKAPSAVQIIDYMSKAFQVPVKGKATLKMRKYLGLYFHRQRGIRLREVRAIDTATHEVAHHLDWYINKRLSKDYKTIGRPAHKELLKLGKELYGKTKPPGGYASEGFAEYIRLALTTENAEEKAPEFTKYWQEKYLPNHPSEARKLEETRKLIDKWRSAGAESRVESQISRKTPRGPIWEILSRGILSVDTEMRDRFAPLVKGLKKAGIKIDEIPPIQNPVELAVRYADKEGAITRGFVLIHTTDINGKPNGKSLADILEPVANDIRTFMRWNYSRVALMRHSQGKDPGISMKDAQYVFDKYGGNDNKEWIAISDAITDWNHRVLDYCVQAGSVTPELAKTIKDKNPVYMPLMREFKPGEIARGGGGAGRGYVELGRTVKRMKGSSREVREHIEAMIQQTQRMVSIANKTRVAKALAALESKYPGLADVIWKVPAPTKVTRIARDEIIQKLVDLGADIPEDVSDLPEQFAFFTADSKYWGKDNIIPIISESGKPVFYEVSPEIFRVMKGIDSYHLPWFLNATVGAASRMIRLGATGLNPGFGLIRNFIKDAGTMFFTGEHAKLGPLSSLQGVGKDIANTEMAKLYKGMGGQMAGAIGYDRIATQHLRSEMLTSNGKRWVIHQLFHPITAARELFSISELGPRIQEFDKALAYGEKKWGKDSPNALLYSFNAAQDVTVNFTRGGNISRILNTIIPFFNVSIQGPDKIYRSAKKHPYRFMLLGLAGFTAPTLWWWWENKDEEWYQNLGLREKMDYWHFRVPRTNHILRIPKPFEVGYLFASIPEAVIDQKYHENPDQVKDSLKYALERTAPSIVPGVAQPVLEVYANKNWNGQPILSESDKRKLPKDQYKPYTTMLMKKIGEWFNVSPIQAEHIANGYTGGLFSRIASNWDLYKKGAETPSDLPIVGTLFERDPDRPNMLIERFYKTRDRLSQESGSGVISKEDKIKLSKYNSASRKLSDQWKALKEAKNYEERKAVYKKIRDLIESVESGEYQSGGSGSGSGRGGRSGRSGRSGR